MGEIVSLEAYRERRAQRHPRAKRVVLADADPVAADVVADMLVTLGYQPIRCGHAAEAFEAALGADAVLCELGWRLPDGTPWIAAVQAARPDLPLAVLTAWLDHPDCRNGAVAGVDLVLAKPLRLTDLAWVVRYLLSGRQARAGAGD
jgi:DNA-binding response OmpR family regulator